MKSILILGASGYIGTSLVAYLNSLGCYRVYEYTRNVKKTFSGENNPIYGDYSTEDWQQFFKRWKVDVIIDLISSSTPSPNVSNIDREINLNLISTVKLLKAIPKNVHYIYLSSGGAVYGESESPRNVDDFLRPISCYGAIKCSVEHFISVLSLYNKFNYTILRVANPYGFFQKEFKIFNQKQGVVPLFIYNLWKGVPITLYGNTVRDYIYIDDVLILIGEVIKQSSFGKTFNVGTGIGTTMMELVNMIEEVSERRFSKINIKENRVCDVKNNVLDISQTQDALGWMPKIPIKQGLGKVVKLISSTF